MPGYLSLIGNLLPRKREALFPGAERVPEAVMREAFAASGEKHLGLSRFFYSRLLGPDWDYALLGFAYVKCIDNVVDDEQEPEVARRLMVGHRRLMEAAYAGELDAELPIPERFGYRFFRQDATHGAVLKPCFEDIFSAMEADVERRGRVLSAAALDRHLVETGTPAIYYLTRFISPHLEMDRSYLELVSRAYLWADSLLDLDYDLEHGIINIPAEDVERFGLTPAPSDDGLRAWVTEQSRRTLAYFRRALDGAARLEDPSIETLCHLYLRRKRKRFLSFLERERIPAHGEPADTPVS